MLAAVSGCASRTQSALPPPRELLVVVTPVINLSGDPQMDTLRITDLLASEFLSFRQVQVVPVNLSAAALAAQGLARIESPEQAYQLGRELGADAVIVAAVTEWDPYDPPVLGMVMQWYPIEPATRAHLDPTAVSRQAVDAPSATQAAEAVGAPQRVWTTADAPDPGAVRQVQRVFQAAERRTEREVREYARCRDRSDSPYAWRRYVKSQELFVRYCGWSLIRTMLQQVGREEADRNAGEDSA
ncbi:MAG: hypothetical protein IPM64_12030 [Phycisphaerales bacterium]|nr:hypothetical protein [Phycisphaerales bacterium]